jgi:RNA polymerase sigma-70 factor (ECF subfamily)
LTRCFFELAAPGALDWEAELTLVTSHASCRAMTGDFSVEMFQRALSAERSAVRELIVYMLPVVRARVLRALTRRGRAHARDPKQELDDVTQEVLAALFADDARVLRSWDAARGLSLLNFVGLVAERQAAALFRTDKRSPWTEDPTLSSDLEQLSGESVAPDRPLASREQLSALLDRLRECLSPLGLHLFYELIVEERPVTAVGSAMNMSTDAVYAWRSRLARLAQKIAREQENSEELSTSDVPLQRPTGDAEP